MTIALALAQLGVYEAALTIAAPVVVQTKRVYTYSPGRQAALSDCPAWMHSYTLTRREIGPTKYQFFTIHSQLFIDDADTDRGAAIATAFLDAYITVLSLAANSSWAGTIAHLVGIRGGDPTVALLEWAGRSYPGLDLYLDLKLLE